MTEILEDWSKGDPTALERLMPLFYRGETGETILTFRRSRKVRPDIIATGSPGCHIQLTEGVRRFGLRAEVVHPVVLLDRANRE